MLPKEEPLSGGKAYHSRLPILQRCAEQAVYQFACSPADYQTWGDGIDNHRRANPCGRGRFADEVSSEPHLGAGVVSESVVRVPRDLNAAEELPRERRALGSSWKSHERGVRGQSAARPKPRPTDHSLP